MDGRVEPRHDGKLLRNREFVMAGPRVTPGDDPAIHGMRQCLRESV
jgi:hypothetical protein